MFHMEQARWGIHRAQTRRNLDGRYQNLCPARRQGIHNQALMGVIEFRGQIVQGDDRPFAAGIGKQLRLRQHARERAQLFLTA